MTAQSFIDSVKPMLSGLAVETDDTTLLSFLNMTKNEIARDTMLWIEGEEITTIEATTKYELSGDPIQILDIYDSNYTLIERGKYSVSGKGYFQISPNTIQLTYTPMADDTLYVNYYKTPDDYALTDTIDIPSTLHKATRHLIISEALNMFKGEKEIANAKNHMSNYERQIEKFLAQTDTSSIETLLQVDMIIDKGLV